ncbi:GATA transcription factor [Actinidia chinensis var. chinensis]|uniref:GATA transcription factor n=1 Tax=Actinidia chinensis var. chinensis TaxID=1590841 RepID=A0A2R6R6Q4_ACTCC|nr:GATA transcription factor [Actinidia chinensis var. chinensis]
MEYGIEARALKSSVLSELAVISNQQALFDEFRCVNGVTCDDFSVDVFLDFSNEELTDNFGEEDSEEEEKDSLSTISQDRVEDDSSNSTTFSGTGDSGSISAGELAVAVDDFEDLEWLSQFADDSVSELSLLCPAGDFKESTSMNRPEPVSRPAIQRTPVLCFSSPVPAKARSKRARPSGRAWYRDLPSLSESSSTPSSSSGSSQTSVLFFSNPVRDLGDGVLKPPAKKQKRPTAETDGEAGGCQTQRRCSHCQVQKTPQWRAGPLGAKTLCNACGVRYKSGRLFPEYRPACSPTFSGDVHSNSHRKVLEMRRKKEVPEAESGFTSMVPSF